MRLDVSLLLPDWKEEPLLLLLSPVKRAEGHSGDDRTLPDTGVRQPAHGALYNLKLSADLAQSATTWQKGIIH